MSTHRDPAELLAHADSLRGFVRSLLRDDAAADDVVQETWIRAAARAPDAPGHDRPWLFAVARNLVRQRHRASTRRDARERVAARPEADGPDPAAVAERVETLQRVTRAVLDLDEPYRSTLLLRFFDDEPVDRIAARAGDPPATVRTRIRRGLDQVRARLDRESTDWRVVVAPFAGFGAPAPRPASPWRGVAAILLLFAVGAWLLPILVGRALLDGPAAEVAAATPVAPTSGTGAPAPGPDVNQAPADVAAAPPPHDRTAPPRVDPVRERAAASPAPPPTSPTADARTAAQPPPDPPAAPAPKRTDGPNTLRSVGSDTMNGLMTGWAEGLARAGSTLQVVIDGRGSSTAPPALAERTADLAPMAREMKEDELAHVERSLGRKPVRVKVAWNAIDVLVHRDNPVASLTLAQVDAIFSSTRKRGGAAVTTWGGVGLTGAWADRPINIHGRNSASGAYGYFKERALMKGDFRNTVHEQPGSASVVQSVSEDRFAIGYAWTGHATAVHATAGVRAVALAETSGAQAVAPEAAAVRDGSYPLGRPLLLFVDLAGDAPRADLVRTFLAHVLSATGQAGVSRDGFLALSELEIRAERGSLGLVPE